MVTSVPAWFGSKGRTRKPLGLDVTTITDTSNSMGPYINFITSKAVYQSLETALQSQNIGVSSQNENKYSFCVAGNSNDVKPPLSRIEKDVVISAPLFPRDARWALGEEILGDDVTYPTYNLTGSEGENVTASLNTIQAEYRDYNTSNQRITIGGSDLPGYVASIDNNPEYPSIYVGVHELIFFTLAENPNAPIPIPPKPSGILVGFVYTTDTLGTAIYIDGTNINYRENMPLFAINVRPRFVFPANTLQLLINQAVATNGALYDIAFFSTPERYALLAESLGSVLGKYLYSLT